MSLVNFVSGHLSGVLSRRPRIPADTLAAALDHLEHAMPGVLAAPEACRLLWGGLEPFVTHLTIDDSSRSLYGCDCGGEHE